MELLKMFLRHFKNNVIAIVYISFSFCCNYYGFMWYILYIYYIYTIYYILYYTILYIYYIILYSYNTILYIVYIVIDLNSPRNIYIYTIYTHPSTNPRLSNPNNTNLQK